MRGLIFLTDFVIEAEALDRPGRHVLDHDVGLLDHLLDDLEPLRRFQVDRYRLLVDVELVEVPRVVVGLARAQPAAGIAPPRILDLDHLGAEPGQHLGAGRARLELGEVDHLDALQKIEVLGVVAHRCSSRCAQMLAYSLRLPTPHRNAFLLHLTAAKSGSVLQASADSRREDDSDLAGKATLGDARVRARAAVDSRGDRSAPRFSLSAQPTLHRLSNASAGGRGRIPR